MARHILSLIMILITLCVVLVTVVASVPLTIPNPNPILLDQVKVPSPHPTRGPVTTTQNIEKILPLIAMNFILQEANEFPGYFPENRTENFENDPTYPILTSTSIATSTSTMLPLFRMQFQLNNFNVNEETSTEANQMLAIKENQNSASASASSSTGISVTRRSLPVVNDDILAEFERSQVNGIPINRNNGPTSNEDQAIGVVNVREIPSRFIPRGIRKYKIWKSKYIEEGIAYHSWNQVVLVFEIYPQYLLRIKKAELKLRINTELTGPILLYGATQESLDLGIRGISGFLLDSIPDTCGNNTALFSITEFIKDLAKETRPGTHTVRIIFTVRRPCPIPPIKQEFDPFDVKVLAEEAGRYNFLKVIYF